MQSRVRGEESPTFMHSSRGSGCACVCRPCISSAHPMAIVIAMPEVRNARLFILLSRFGYLIQMLQSKAAGRKGRLAKDLTVAPAPSELPAVHIIAGQISESRRCAPWNCAPSRRSESREPGRATECQVSTEAIQLNTHCAFPFLLAHPFAAGTAVLTHLTRGSPARTFCRVNARGGSSGQIAQFLRTQWLLTLFGRNPRIESRGRRICRAFKHLPQHQSGNAARQRGRGACARGGPTRQQQLPSNLGTLFGRNAHESSRRICRAFKHLPQHQSGNAARQRGRGACARGGPTRQQQSAGAPRRQSRYSRLGVGGTLYIPISAHGARFEVGHAAQADGEGIRRNETFCRPQLTNAA